MMRRLFMKRSRKNSKIISLIGDSIIDNKTYVSKGELSVLEHLEQSSPYKFAQLAIDGHTTRDVLRKQLIDEELSQSSDIVVSVGGNDLLQNLSVLFEKDISDLNHTLSGLQNFIFSPLQKRFETIVEKLSSYRANLLLCTVYEGDLGRTDEFRGVLDSSKIMASSFNDIVYKTAKKFNADVLELRQIFTESDDYANPIEPSHIGGEKLANAITEWARTT